MKSIRIDIYLPNNVFPPNNTQAHKLDCMITNRVTARQKRGKIGKSGTVNGNFSFVYGVFNITTAETKRGRIKTATIIPSKALLML